MIRSARFSPDRTWRYALYRTWDERPPAMFVCLNPSTADETTDDNTVRRCIDFAQRWGHGGLVMTNLYAFRTTYPKQLFKAEDPVGPDNDRWLAHCALRAGVVVAAWGVHAQPARVEAVRKLLSGLSCLGRTKHGAPKHPLYLSKYTQLEPYSD